MSELYQNPVEETKEPKPRFLLDAMLGSLARWLRLLGCDVALAADDESDATLIRRARAEERVIVTRDTGMARRRGVHVFLITSTDLAEQLRQMVTYWNIGIERIGTRCLVCNHELELLSREEAFGQVPPYVWVTQSQFLYCPGCERIYWPGTHWEKMSARLAGMLGLNSLDGFSLGRKGTRE
jgi:uncharacterized protein with PIN domain